MNRGLKPTLTGRQRQDPPPQAFRRLLATFAIGISFAASGFAQIWPTPHVANQAPDGVGDRLIIASDFVQAPLHRSLRNDVMRDALGYTERDEPRVFVSDLNDDGHPERLFISSEALCARSGCRYILIEGKSGREIGQFVDTLVLLGQRRNGFPLIETLGPVDDGQTKQTRYSFSGQYQPDESALLNSAAAEQRRSRLIQP